MEQTPRTFTLPDTVTGHYPTGIAAHTCDDPLRADAFTPGTGDTTTLAVPCNKPFTFDPNNGKTSGHFPATGVWGPERDTWGTVWPEWATI